MVFSNKQVLFIALAGIVSPSLGHNIVNQFIYNGETTDSCLRIAPSVDPITDLTDSAMACNNAPMAASKCSVKGGDQVSFQWSADPNLPPSEVPEVDGQKVGVTDTSHKGPCAVYMKKVDDATSAEGTGDGWFKVSEDGLDSSGTFCTDRLREADASQPAAIPSNIEPGDYLLRAEMLTLNNAGPASLGGEEQPQFYVGCVQVTVEGTSGGASPEEVSIPGYLTIDSPGLIYDIWNSPDGTFSDYPMPGPAPLEDGTGSGTSAAVSSAAPSTNVPSIETTAVSEAEPSTSTRVFESATKSAVDSFTQSSIANVVNGTDPTTTVEAGDAPFATSTISDSGSSSSAESHPYSGHWHGRHHDDSENVAWVTQYVTEFANPTTFVTVTAAAVQTTVYE